MNKGVILSADSTLEEYVNAFTILSGRDPTDEELEELVEYLDSDDDDDEEDDEPLQYQKANWEDDLIDSVFEGTNLECLKYERRHAPKGYTKDHPLKIGGKSFTGGQWIPSEVLAQATPEEKAELEGEYRPEDVSTFAKLKSEWSKVNNSMLAYVDTPDAPQAKAGLKKMKALVKQMAKLRADKGDWDEGIGKPGGPRDVVIVGAGPGGMTAGIVAGTDGLDALVIESQSKFGGQAKYSSRVENFPGFPLGVTGKTLARKMKSQAERLGASFKMGVRVVGLKHDPETGFKEIELSNGEKIKTRSVVIAGGLEFNRLPFKGGDSERVVLGDGEKLAEMSAGKPVVVIGGSNGAAQAALGVARTAEHVYLLSRGKITSLMSDYQVQALANNPKVTVIEGDEAQEFSEDHLVTKHGKTLPAHAVGVFVGSSPKTDWLPEGTAIENKKVLVNQDMQTSIPGVYAIGDISSAGIGRIGVAAGHAYIALKSIWDYFAKMKGRQNIDKSWAHHAEEEKKNWNQK